MKTHKKTKKYIYIICGILSVLLIVYLLAYYYLDGKLSLLSRGNGINYEEPLDESLLDNSLDIDLSDIDVMENGGTLEPPEGEVYSEKDVYNILLIGTDERGEEFERSRADSMMLLSINVKANTLKLISLERALGVSIPNIGDDWLTHTFVYGGPELLMQTIRTYFKVDITRYVRINFYVFETAITDIGGVKVDLTKEEANYMNEIAGSDKFLVGENRFDGPTALVYARMRHLDSDWNRVQRQRNVVQAAINQAVSLSPAKIDLLANKLLPMVETNLSNKEIISLLLEVPGFAGTQADQLTVPLKGTHWGYQAENGRVVIACDYQQNAKIIKNFLYGDGSLAKKQLEDESTSSSR